MKADQFFYELRGAFIAEVLLVREEISLRKLIDRDLTNNYPYQLIVPA